MQSVIRQLPPTNALPPIENLGVLNFREGTNWVTRSYDKRSPPKVLDRIREIQRALWVSNFTVQ